MSKPQVKPSPSPSPSPPLHPITPPESFVDGPWTPPRSEEKPFTQASRILAILHDLKDGKGVNLKPWTTFQLGEGEFDQIERQIERDESLRAYLEHKGRYDFDAYTRRFVIRMPSTVHEMFIDMVSDCIKQQLGEIGNGSGNVAAFARNVRALRSTDYWYPKRDGPPGEESRHSPDAQFKHKKAKYPGVIMEISYSQKWKDVRKLADTYIADSGLCVQAVVGLDIDYGPKSSHMATVSVWRAHADHATRSIGIVPAVDNEPFRDDKGNVTNSSGLQLRLSDFDPPPFAQQLLGGEDRDITITAQQLCQYLAEAEEWFSPDPTSHTAVFPNGYTLRRIVSSSPDTIGSEDEERFVEQEEQDNDRAITADPDWENLERVPQETPRTVRATGQRRGSRRG